MGKQPPKIADKGLGFAQNGRSPANTTPSFYEFSPYNEYDEYAGWSRGVKIKAGWVCEQCGEMDKKLLESHHIKPKEMFPELAKDIENGECLCLYHHAVRHWANEIIRNKILARLAIILWLRYAKSS